MSNKKLSSLLILLIIAAALIFHRSLYAVFDHFNTFQIKTITVQGARLSRDSAFERVLAGSTNDASGNLNRLDIHGLKHELESLNLVKNAEVISKCCSRKVLYRCCFGLN